MLCKAVTHYQTLGIKSSASEEEVRAAFRSLAKKLHPDVSKEKDAEAKFKQLNEAHSVLSDEKSRREYDSTLRRSSSSLSSASVRSGVMQWEVVFVDDDDEEEEEDEDEINFDNWKAKGNNYRSSFQSSQQANRKKAQARKQAMGIEGMDPMEILASLPRKYRDMAKNAFGESLESLSTLEELSEYLAIMEMIEEGGGGFDDEQGDDLIEVLMGQGRASSRRKGTQSSPSWQEGVGGRPSWATFVEDFGGSQVKGGPGRSMGRTGSRGSPTQGRSQREVELEIDQDDVMSMLNELMGGGGDGGNRPKSQRASQRRNKKPKPR